MSYLALSILSEIVVSVLCDNTMNISRCAFCDNCVGDWVEGDDPMTEHTHLFPLCPFVLGYEVGNIPLNSDEHNHGEGIQSQDETGVRWSEQHREPNSAAENVSFTTQIMIDKNVY